MTASPKCTGAAPTTATGVTATTVTGAGVIAAGVTAGADAAHHLQLSRTGPPQGGPVALWSGSAATARRRQILQRQTLTSTNLPATAAAAAIAGDTRWVRPL